MEELGIPDNRLVHVADVTGKDNGAGFSVFRNGQLHAGRAQQVARVDALHLHTLAQIHLLAVFAGGDEFLHPQGILHGVKRLHHRPAGPEVLAVFILRVGLLDMGRVLEHDVHKLGGEAGGENAALEALLYQQGNAAGVVDVGVGHQDIVNIACMEGQAAVIHLVPALLQAAVDEDLLAVYLQAMAAAGNALVSAEKMQFHSGRSFLVG